LRERERGRERREKCDNLKEIKKSSCRHFSPSKPPTPQAKKRREETFPAITLSG
jgi:hypothetical protein